MPAYTPFLTLYKPGGGSTGLIVPDEVVDIDRLNANSDLIDAFAAGWGHAAERNHNLYGPAASLSAVTGMKRGDTYQESDGSFVLWRHDGSNWVTNEGGMYKIRPSSVNAQASIRPDGSVDPGTTGTEILVNGVFTSRFRAYKLLIDLRYSGGPNSSFFQLSTGGVPNAGNIYTAQYQAASGTSSTASVSGIVNSLLTAAALADEHTVEILIMNPVDSSRYTKIQGQSSSIATNGHLSFGGGTNVGTPMDGFRMALQTSAGRAYNGGSITVYGLS